MIQFLLLLSLCCPSGDTGVPPGSDRRDLLSLSVQVPAEPVEETAVDGEEGEPAGVGPIVRFDTEYVAAYYRDSIGLVTSPADWNEREWKTFCAVFYVGLGLFVFDEDIQRWAQRDRELFWAQRYRESAADRVSDWVKPF